VEWRKQGDGFSGIGYERLLTSTNYNTKGIHEQTERLLREYILQAVRN
jgi:hypothetical protein